jgi:hypothetical protein
MKTKIKIAIGAGAALVAAGGVVAARKLLAKGPKPKKMKLVKIWDLPNQTKNVIGMLAIPGAGKALLATATIGYGSGYRSGLFEIDKAGKVRQVGGYTSHETIGHEMFYGPDGKTIYLPIEHGGNKILKYRDGKLSTGGQMPGGWTLAGITHKGQPLVACCARYNGSAGSNPTLHNADNGKKIFEFPNKGIIWSMHIHKGQLCAINAYGPAVIYRDGKPSATKGRVGMSYDGQEILGGGNNAGRGQEDGNIYVGGKAHSTPCQSFEVAYVTRKGRALLAGINPDRLYQVYGGKPVLVAEVPDQKKHRGK